MALHGLILDIIKLTKTHGNEKGLFNVIMFWENADCVSLVQSIILHLHAHFRESASKKEHLFSVYRVKMSCEEEEKEKRKK